MTTENRENVENQKDMESCIQALESYLRQEIDAKQLKNDVFAYAVEQRLIIKAKDWGLKYKQDMSERDYMLLAADAIARFEKNWKHKQKGDDDRGHRFGKSRCFGA